MDNFYKEIDGVVEWLSSFGKDPKGGVTRTLYTDEWLDAQNALKEKLEKIGLKTNFDEIGNLFGRIKGTEFPDEVIATGSHIDTVTNGGKLDGAFGIIAGMIAIKNLIEKHGAPKRSLELISMAEEEGSRFPYAFWGSKNIFGLANQEDVIDAKDIDGKKFVDEMRRCGFDFRKDNTPKDDLKAFLEIHIEQGNFLEMENKSVGVVTSIVGQRRYGIKLKGQANHAGTTLMKYRKDTIEAFARIVTSSLEKAKKKGDPLVLTFGKVDVTPNTVNVVPGETAFTIDCRHTDRDVLKDFTKEIEEDMRNICKDMGIEIEIDMWMDEPPVPMDEEIISIIEKASKDNNLNYKVMHSGAGHDSQIFAPRVATGMIFVPSINGISHNPAENTEVKDLAEGILALQSALYELAYK